MRLKRFHLGSQREEATTSGSRASIPRCFGLALVVLLTSGSPALGQAPTATTGAATGVGSTDATVNGTVNANGDSTTVTFEYGLNTGYGLTAAAVPSPVTGTTDTAVSAFLGELLPNTTYHYRVVATNGNGATYGADMTFTTLPSPPLALTVPATGIGVSSATLNGMVNANGDSTTVTFQYGTDTSYGSTVTADQSPLTGSLVTPVSKAITGLANNTTYHFRVVAVNAGGTTYGADMTFTTGSSGSAPTVTTNAATGVGSSTATVNGTVNANGADTMVTFEYGTTVAYGSTALADQSPVSGSTDTAVSALLADLLPNTTYHFRATATNLNGTTNGTDMTFTTLPLAPTATTQPASAVGPTGATLNGTVNANGSSSTVTFQYGTDTSYGTVTTAVQSPVTGSTDTAVSRAITGLTNGVTYHYRVVAVNTGGTTYGADMTFTTGTTPPTAVTNAATAVGTTTATFNGTVNANNSSTTVTFEYGTDTGYGRTVTASQSPVTGSTNTAVSASVSDLLPATTYHFRVVAQSVGGTSYGADMTLTTLAAPTVSTDPASAVTATGATLNGTVNANGSSTTVTFELGTTTAYGRTEVAAQSPVSGTGDTAVSAAVGALTPNTTYHFRAVGASSAGTSYGADMTFYTGSAPTVTTDPASGVGTTGATLNGTVNANGSSTTVTFEYGLDAGYGSTTVAAQSPVTGTIDTPVSAVLGALTPDTTYHFRVVGANTVGTANGTDMTFTTLPLPLLELTLSKIGVLDDGGDGVADPGDLILYTIEVANTGTETLLNVVVSDPLLGVIACPSGNPIPSLVSGASETCTGGYAITQADLTAGFRDNTATATAQNLAGAPVEGEGTHRLVLAQAALAIPTLDLLGLVLLSLALLVAGAWRLHRRS